jgi:uncharacterized protein YjeT (DUF2065 family)
MKDLLTALALVLVIEGILYAAFPEGMRRVDVRPLPHSAKDRNRASGKIRNGASLPAKAIQPDGAIAPTAAIFTLGSIEAPGSTLNRQCAALRTGA